MIWDFKGRRPLPVRDHVFSIKDGPWLSNKMSKVCRVHVRRNSIDKKQFCLISPQKVARLLAFHLATRDRNLSKPHPDWKGPLTDEI